MYCRETFADKKFIFKTIHPLTFDDDDDGGDNSGDDDGDDGDHLFPIVRWRSYCCSCQGSRPMHH